MKNRVNTKGIVLAVLAACFYAINAPFSKLLLKTIPSACLAGLLYIGAGAGMFFIMFFSKKSTAEKKLEKKDLPFVIGMILLDIAAPICLLVGLSRTSPENAALLNNFEIVATSIIAYFIFKEKISKRLAAAIVIITAASVLLSFENIQSLKFSEGSFFVLMACICWGFENNCTKKLSGKNPCEIVVVKGLCSGTGSLVIGLVSGEKLIPGREILYALLLGFTAYGLSITCYIYAQRYLGAARTSSYYALAPFISVAASFIVFKNHPGIIFIIALILMIIGAVLIPKE